MIRWWIDVWNRREVPTMLAAVRIGVGLTLFLDFVTVGAMDLVVPLMASEEAGGFAQSNATWSRWYAQILGTGQGPAWGLYLGLVLSSFLMTIGAATRISTLVLLLLSAQWALTLPPADRAIDTLLRNALAILVFSEAGRTWSVDARLRTGSLWGDGAEVPAWPRYLLVVQLVIVYFTAGVSKYAQHWWPWGDYAGLWIILHDWSYTAVPAAWLEATRPVSYWMTQFGTFTTMAFQWTYPIVLLHYFPPRGEAGWFRARFERHSMHLAWIATGAAFHVGIGLTMSLGIFPWGTLALYPAYFHPDEIQGLVARVLRPRGLPQTDG
ncbi:MAG: HTTM domain-containing protein [Myxococcota bacterium]